LIFLPNHCEVPVEVFGVLCMVLGSMAAIYFVVVGLIAGVRWLLAKAS
jgi:hypothetical protein